MAKNYRLMLKKLDSKLIVMGLTKARATNNDYVETLIKGMTMGRDGLPQADREMLNDYLEIPPGTMMEIS